MDVESFLININECLTTKSVDEIKYECIISELSSGKVKFLSIVESLKEILTNENVNIRERGVEFLSRIITHTSEELFNSSEITVLVNFYCDCLKGHHNLLPATIRGFLGLINMKHIVKEDILKILVNLFQHVNCSTQLHADRFNIYRILKNTVTDHLQDVKDMGPDFVFGVIAFIEGETDPKCLHFIFKFLPLFIREFDLGHLSEELFEVLSCYFPIDFNAAAKDDTVITREDLAEGLLECLTANETFCVQCLSVIFEKLDSNFKTAKLDSYRLLQTCSKSIKVENIEIYLSEFWKIIQKDVLPGKDKEISEAGLSTLTDIMWLLSNEESDKNVLSKFLEEIITTVKSLASRVNENMFQPAMSILVAASTKCKVAAWSILCFLKPFYQIVDGRPALEMKIILTSFLSFLKFCKIDQSTTPEQLECYTELVNLFVCSTNFDEYDVRQLAYSGVCQILPDCSEETRQKLYKMVIHNLNTKDDVKTSKEFLNVIRQLAQYHPKELYTLLFDNKNISPHHLEPYTAGYLWALSLLADHPEFTEFVVSILLKFIVNSEHYIVGLESLLNACRCANENGCLNFCDEIHKKFDALELLMSWQKNIKLDLKTLYTFCESIALIVRRQNLFEQQKIVDRFTEFLVDDLNHLKERGDCVSDVGCTGNDSSVNIDQSLVILEAVLGSIYPEVSVPNSSIIRELLVEVAVHSPNEINRLHASRLLASIVNKSNEIMANDISNRVFELIFSQLEKPSEICYKSNYAFLFIWMTKGVIISGNSSFEKYLLRWFETLSRVDIGRILAENFQIVLENENLYLNFESHCNVRVLYRQRIFGFFSKLLKMYETSPEPVKANYLLALACLLQGIPNHLIQTELANVIVVLLQCLSSGKPDILLTALKTTKELLESKEKILADHIGSFVSKFLNLSTYEGCMKIRMEALKCLFFYGFYETYILLPFKSRVIRDLEICLDDKKRLVRKEAVKARCRWFLVGAPGENVLQS